MPTIRSILSRARPLAVWPAPAATRTGTGRLPAVLGLDPPEKLLRSQIAFASKLEPPEGLRRLKNLRQARERTGPIGASLAAAITRLTTATFDLVEDALATLETGMGKAELAISGTSPPPDATATAVTLLKVINEAPDVMMAARSHAGWAGSDDPGDGRRPAITERLRALEERRDELLSHYRTMIPKGTADATPTPVAESRENPELPGLAKDEAARLKVCMDEVGAAMAKVQPAPAPLERLREQGTLLDKALGRSGNINPDAALKDAGYDWTKVKEEYRRRQNDQDKPEDYMRTMWWFRRNVVDKAMAKLQGEYAFTWVSVGSSSLESDYDISITGHGTAGGKPVHDSEIVDRFNKRIEAEFAGRQPGTVFDTNLYASAATEGDIGTPAMRAMAEQAQDVGALMKLRRYMGWEEYVRFQTGTLSGIGAKNRKDMERQFEEADALYFIAVREQLVAAGHGKHAESQEDVTPAIQKELCRELAQLQQDDPDTTMRVNNALYVKAMAKLRDYDKENRKPDASDAVLANLKAAQAGAVYYAAEAYHSEGAFRHVVGADQGAAALVRSDPAAALEEYLAAHRQSPGEELSGEEKLRLTKVFESDGIRELKRVRKNRLTLNQLLQSFNENLGDLLKDVAHHDHESPFPGKGFYRASKYLGRLCDSLALLQSGNGNDPGFTTSIGGVTLGGMTAEHAGQIAATLTAYRGGKLEFKDQAPEEGEAWACREMQKLGCTTLADLATIAKTCGQKVNRIVREEIAATMNTGGKEHEQAYFRNRPGR